VTTLGLKHRIHPGIDAGSGRPIGYSWDKGEAHRWQRCCAATSTNEEECIVEW